MNQRMLPGIDFNVAVHFNGWQGNKIQKCMVNPGFRGEQQFKLQILGDQVDISGFQCVGDVIQKNGQIAAVDIVQPVYSKGVQGPVVVLLDASAVMSGFDMIEYKIILPEMVLPYLYTAKV